MATLWISGTWNLKHVYSSGMKPQLTWCGKAWHCPIQTVSATTLRNVGWQVIDLVGRCGRSEHLEMVLLGPDRGVKIMELNNKIRPYCKQQCLWWTMFSCSGLKSRHGFNYHKNERVESNQERFNQIKSVHKVRSFSRTLWDPKSERDATK